jgi:outer membrane protein assembly factor BamA
MRFLFVLAFLAGAAVAQDSEAAMQLYNKGVKLQDAGKGDDARKTFQAIIKEYPASAYSKLAKEGLERPLIASVEFKDVKPLSEKEIRKTFEIANAHMIVGHVYDADYADETRRLLAQMMVKRKIKAKDVTVTAKELPDRKYAVTITIVK